MHSSTHIYHHGEHELHGYLTYDNNHNIQRPAVLVIHDWSGRNEFSCQKATFLAELGYIGFAVDMYGAGRLGETVQEKQMLMQPLVHDRQLLRERIHTALNAIQQLPMVDKTRIAVMGFCFGGLCALDLARSGADVAGVISVHGLLNKPENIANQTIKAKILALHGFDDPMVTPTDVTIFCQEMTQAGVDWQMHMYGQTKHAFTNPLAHDQALGTVYNAQAADRAMRLIVDFLDELFI